MEEKTLLISKQGNIAKIVSVILVVIGIVAFNIIWNMCEDETMLQSMITNFDYFITNHLLFYGSMTLLPAFALAVIIYFGTARCKMTITDKRVYGNASFGKRVDLPLDSISAVGTSILKGVAVATSSGRIKFYDIENQEQMHKILSELLIKRQEKDRNQETNVVKQEIPKSNADELKKFKDLLDNGVITQEEFDEKKKQLLGL